MLRVASRDILAPYSPIASKSSQVLSRCWSLRTCRKFSLVSTFARPLGPIAWLQPVMFEVFSGAILVFCWMHRLTLTEVTRHSMFKFIMFVVDFVIPSPSLSLPAAIPCSCAQCWSGRWSLWFMHGIDDGVGAHHAGPLAA